jgi:uncharacterized protein YjbI with pentapeptide repeats
MQARSEFNWACRLLAAVVAVLAPLTMAEARCDDRPRNSVEWSGCKKSHLVLVQARLERAIMQKVDLSGTDLSEAVLTGADLEKANVSAAWFAKANLSAVNLAGAFGTRTRFDDAKLRGASMVKVELSRTNFIRADLTGADASGAQLARAIMKDTVLSGTKLINANLARADLREAKLAGADLTGGYLFLTRIEGADLTAVRGLTKAQLEIACGDGSTRLPAGLAAPASWPCPPLEAAGGG